MKVSVTMRLIVIGLLPILLFIGLIIIYVLPVFETEIYEEKEIQTREMVNAALGVVENYYNLFQEGVLTEEEAKRRAEDTIGWMTFGPGRQDYFWINDYYPRMVMHPFRPDLDGEDLSRFSDPMGVYLFQEMVNICEQDGGGYVRYHWQYYDDTRRIEPKLSYVASFDPWEWIIGTGVYIDDVDAAIAATRNRLILWVSMILLITAGILIVIVRPIIRNIKDSTGFIVNFLAEGNFSVDVPEYALKLKDEYGDLARALMSTVENLREMVKAIHTSAEETSSISEELAATTQETTSSIEEVAASVTQFSSLTETLSQNSQSMSEKAQEVNTLAYSGQEKMEESKVQMQGIIDTSKETGKTIGGLEKSSQEINSIAEVISSVADQTNLLALNAAIEAARAGEHGQGFAVVAEEVRKLAEETKDSVSQIKDIIQRLSENTSDVVSVIDSNNQQISIGAKTLEETGEFFTLIVEKVVAVAQEVESVASASQELSASGEEISAVTEEQSASMEEISTSAETLSAMSQELRSLVEQLSV